MVLGYYLYKLPYSATYKLLKWFKRSLPVVFYCADLIDWEVFEPVQKYLEEIPIVTDNREVEDYFQKQNRRTYRLPCFPSAVIMCRHSYYKFPADEIIKIGMRHGPYHFKRLTRSENYNRFDIFLLSSQSDVAAARSIGVNNSLAVGFPKLDPVITIQNNPELLIPYKKRASIDDTKETILFTTTWFEEGMSAFYKWRNRVGELSERYNILITLHPKIPNQEHEYIQSIPGAFYIAKERTLPYIIISDYCIGDTSSILAECSALNKPLITFRTEGGRRSLPGIDELLNRISIRIDSFDEIESAISRYRMSPDLLEKERKEANVLMFDDLDGQAGWRAARAIIDLLPGLKKT